MAPSEPRSEILALLRFHLGVGARLAARVLAPVVVGAVGGAMLLGVDFQATLSKVLFGAGRAGGSGAVMFLLCLGAASVAAPRIGRGLDGWLRHLPVRGTAHRRAAALAATVAQTPVLLLLLYLSFAVFRGWRPWLPDLATVAVAAVAAAWFATPCERGRLAKPLALAAGFLGGTGGAGPLAAGAVLLIAADLAAGGLPRPARPARRRHPAKGAAGGAAGWIEARIAWRALGWRLAGAFAAAALGLASAGFFVANNDLPAQHVALAARLGGMVAVMFLLAQMAESLAVFRPAWPWARSLPASAARRVLFDAGFLALHAVPLVALTAWIDPFAVPVVAAAVPFLALRAAGAMRRAPERRAGAAGEVFAQGFLAAAAVALLPWVALLLLAAAPWALRAAAERDRRQKVSRWLDLHHLAVGDPQSWSA